jgi:hypothetical protein
MSLYLLHLRLQINFNPGQYFIVKQILILLTYLENDQN